MIPFTAFYGMHMNPFDKGLSSKDAYRTPDLEQMQGRLIHLRDHQIGRASCRERV